MPASSSRRSPSLTTKTVILAALFPVAALSFTLPFRHRLREPNDVHHSFREKTHAMHHGSNLLAGGPLRATASGDRGFEVLDAVPGLAELQLSGAMTDEKGVSSPYTGTTFEEDLFLIDKGTDLTALLEPMATKELFFGDGQPSFVPLTDLFDQGVSATEEAVAKVNADMKEARDSRGIAPFIQGLRKAILGGSMAVGSGARRYAGRLCTGATQYVSSHTRLLCNVVAHLLDQARAQVLKARLMMVSHLGELLSQVEAGFRPRPTRVGDRFTRPGARAEPRALSSESEQVGVQAVLAVLRARWAKARALARAYHGAVQAAAGSKLRGARRAVEAWTQRLGRRGEGAATLWPGQVQKAVRRSLLKGGRLVSHLKARGVERWVLGERGGKGLMVERQADKDVGRGVSGVVSGFSEHAMKVEDALSLPVSAPALPVPLPVFPMAHVLGGSDELTLRRREEQGLLLLVPSFDDEPRMNEEEVVVGKAEEEVDGPGGWEGVEAGDVSEGGAEAGEERVEDLEVVEVGDRVEDVMESGVEEQGGSEEEEGEDGDDDHYDGLGLTTTTKPQAESEEEDWQEAREEEAAEGGAWLLRFGGRGVSDEERAVMEKLQARLVMLPESLTHWVSPGDLLRYVRAFKHVEDAWVALRKTCVFRRERGVDVALRPDLAEKFAGSPLAEEMFWMGLDREGDPVLVFRTALHQPGRFTTEEYLAYLLYLIEKGRELYGLGQRTQISFLVDRQGGGLANQDPKVVLALVPVLQAYYPECLKKTFIAPVNVIFQFIWKVFTLVLAKDTANRVRLLSAGDLARDGGGLREVFYDGQLMKHLGGTLEGYEKGGRGEGGGGNGSVQTALSSA